MFKMIDAFQKHTNRTYRIMLMGAICVTVLCVLDIFGVFSVALLKIFYQFLACGLIMGHLVSLYFLNRALKC